MNPATDRQRQDQLKLDVMRDCAKQSFEEIERGEFVEVADSESLDQFMSHLDAASRRSRS